MDEADLVGEAGPEILLRPMGQGDINFVTNSWLKNNRKGFFARGVGDDIYYNQHHKILERLVGGLRDPNDPSKYLVEPSIVMMACDPRDPSVLYGYLCGQFVNNFLVLHYVYVKDRYKFRYDKNKAPRLGLRGMEGPLEQREGYGIGTMMLEKMLSSVNRANLRGIVYTHETYAGQGWLEHLYDTCRLEFKPVYNPYFLFAAMAQ